MKTIKRKLLFILLPLAMAVTSSPAQTGGDQSPPTDAATAVSNAVTNVVVSDTNKIVRAHRGPGVVTINQGPHEGGPTFPELVILTLTTFMLPVSIIAMVFYSRHRRTAMLHDTLRLMIEKGVAIPPELLQPAARPNPVRKANDFRIGMILVGIGFAFLLIELFDRSASVGSIGFIPLFIGVAFLISWKVGQNSNQPGK